MILLAAVNPFRDPDDPMPVAGRMTPATFSVLVLLGVLLVVVVLVVIWAVYIRKRRRRDASSRRHRHRHHRRHSARRAAAAFTEIKEYIQQKQRRRRGHRPRNPTLAQTGGLPPLRPDEPPAVPPPASHQPN